MNLGQSNGDTYTNKTVFSPWIEAQVISSHGLDLVVLEYSEYPIMANFRTTDPKPYMLSFFLPNPSAYQLLCCVFGHPLSVRHNSQQHLLFTVCTSQAGIRQGGTLSQLLYCQLSCHAAVIMVQQEQWCYEPGRSMNRLGFWIGED